MESQRFNSYLKVLPSVMIERILRFKRWQDAHASLIGKLLVKEGLSYFKNFNCSLDQIKFTHLGRPFIDSHPIDFNVSHSGKYVVCVLSSHNRVGIDIEEIIPIQLEEFRLVFNDTEYKIISEAKDVTKTFYSFWTMKEALLKALGCGLTDSIQNILQSNTDNISTGKNWFLNEVRIPVPCVIHIASKDKSQALVKELSF